MLRRASQEKIKCSSYYDEISRNRTQDLPHIGKD
jgi:hypothetical protein